MKVAVLTSGGVDSSVALRLLAEQGHDVTAFYLKIWLEDELQHLGDCPWETDLEYVRKICAKIKAPLKVIPMQKEYWDRVVKYTIAEAKAGRTPNPDVLCNQFIKFGLFYERIGKEFEKVATGHYAQIECRKGEYHLKRAPDPVKDQTYFLSRLNQKQLARAMFPIGHLKKSQVRALATKYKLPNQNRPDSQGICFLGKFKYRDFIAHHLGEKPGDFVDAVTGKRVGEHKGCWFYTIGQRYGLGLSGGPWFVIRKDVKRNRVYLAYGYNPQEAYQKEFKVRDLRWIAEKPTTISKLKVKIRHGEAFHDCILTFRGKSGRVKLKKPVHGIAPGQFAVFYKGKYCLGSGVIN
ncbi:MAG: tRNA 2-thiouridine(34) synthase MnmA [Candidatus Peregrinibacteria bacterium]